MPFDPAKPAFGSPDSSAEMRDQLNALKALIDAQAAQISGLNTAVASLQGQLNAAISGTSSNSNSVTNLGLSIGNNPPQPSDVQPIADKVDELINALRR